MKFDFHPRAEQEFDKAVRFYEECQPGLGLDFAEEVYAAIARSIPILKPGRGCQSIRDAAWYIDFPLV